MESGRRAGDELAAPGAPDEGLGGVPEIDLAGAPELGLADLARGSTDSGRSTRGGCDE
ncbi:MAG: hypothetical protein OEM15_02160 [Myxococcales bacterium]|nr:hypothetical protein [Myxococcales bacterium]MDH3482582.1 hypothetical protein [Myxococcales bacterium]